MIETKDDFTNRLHALGRKHKSMTNGYVTKVTKDGLIVVQPKPKGAGRFGMMVKFAAILVVGFIGFKTFAVASVGPVTYNERLSKLENGTVIEQVGARALAIDPVTETLADTVGPIGR